MSNDKEDNMIIRRVNIGGYNYSLSDFTQICEKNSIIIIKNTELATFIRLKSKPMQIKLIELKDSIFLLESFGNQSMIPSDLKNCSTIYYMDSDSCGFGDENQIVNNISEKQLSAFLEQIDYKHAKWQVLSKCFIDGKLYVRMKSKSTRNREVEYWFSDLHTCIWDVDYEWVNFLYGKVLKNWLNEYYDQK